MKFKNKFLVAALAITMTIGPSLTKDFSNLSIRSNVAYASEEPVEAKKDYERKENRIVSYIKEKNMLASSGNQETEDLKNEINKILEAFKGIEDRSNYKYLPKEYKDLLINAKALVAKEDAKKTDLETMKKSLDEKSPKIMEFINKDELALRKEILTKNLDALEKKLNDNKSKISEEDFNAFNTFIKGVKEGMEKEDVNKDILDQSIEEVGTKDKDLDEAIKNSGHSDQIDLKSYESAIAEAKSIKEKEDYKRSSEEARKAFDAALTNLENYIKDTSKFKKDEADNLKKALETATSKLDGKDYFNLLEEAKKKLDKNKDKLGDKYDALLKTYNELADENNKEYTVDRVRAFSDDIDSKLKSATLRPSTNNPSSKPSTSKPKNSGVQVSAKKVAVPRAQNGSRKSAKSLVRTGIDSIKIFGVVAVVAVVLLLLTRNKSKNEKNDNEK